MCTKVNFTVDHQVHQPLLIHTRRSFMRAATRIAKEYLLSNLVVAVLWFRLWWDLSEVCQPLGSSPVAR